MKYKMSCHSLLICTLRSSSKQEKMVIMEIIPNKVNFLAVLFLGSVIKYNLQMTLVFL